MHISNSLHTQIHVCAPMHAHTELEIIDPWTKAQLKVLCCEKRYPEQTLALTAAEVNKMSPKHTEKLLTCMKNNCAFPIPRWKSKISE